MKKLLFALFVGLYLANPLSIKAQDYDDLLVLFVDEKYEKCFYKSEKYTLNDKTKKHPMPYLYASQALYAMSLDHKYVEDFPKAFIKALQYATKYRKKDKAYAHRSDAEEFLEMLKEDILIRIEDRLLVGDEKSYKKALSLMKKVNSFDPLCLGSKLLRGDLEILTKNKTEGKKMVAAAMENINKIGQEGEVSFGEMTLSQQKFLMTAIMSNAGITKEKDLSAARKMISIGQPYFGEDNEDCHIDSEDLEPFRELYKEITG